jgi:hypothetical protein
VRSYLDELFEAEKLIDELNFDPQDDVLKNDPNEELEYLTE